MTLIWIMVGFQAISIGLLVWSIFLARKNKKYSTLWQGFLLMVLMGIAFILMSVYTGYTHKHEAAYKVPKLLEQREYLLWQIDCLGEDMPERIIRMVATEVSSFNETVIRYQNMPYNSYNGVFFSKDYEVIELLPELLK